MKKKREKLESISLSEVNILNDRVCFECGKTFNDIEWDDRHSDFGGNDVHFQCCPICNKD